MEPNSWKTRAPFGVAVQRFNKIGFHPQLDVSGVMKKVITDTGPGTYDAKSPHCTSKKGMSWKVKAEVEEFSKFQGFRNAKLLRERAFLKTLGGPGFADINAELYKKQNSSVYDNIGFGSVKRFKDETNNNPPLGTYSKAYKSCLSSKKTFSKVPHFEWDGLMERFKDKTPSYRVPPNLYDPYDPGSINVLLNKVVSLRGPYDMFTGPRDETTIKNHFACHNLKIPDYFYIPPSDLDILLKDKKRRGKFYKTVRFSEKHTINYLLRDVSITCKDPNYPGPNYYNIQTEGSKKSEMLHPFNSSNIHARPPTDWSIFPGPVRYKPKHPQCFKLKRPSWVFLTKDQRKFYIEPEVLNSF